MPSWKFKIQKTNNQLAIALNTTIRLLNIIVYVAQKQIITLLIYKQLCNLKDNQKNKFKKKTNYLCTNKK